MKNENLWLKPFAFPPVLPEQTALFNALSSRGLRLALNLGSTEVRLTWFSEIPHIDPCLGLTLSIDGREWRLYLSNTDLFRVHPLFEDERVRETSPEALPPELLLALSDVLAAPVFEVLSLRLGIPGSVSGLSAVNAGETNPVIGGRLDWTGRERNACSVFFTLAADADAVSALLGRLRGLPLRADGAFLVTVDRIPFSLRTEAGELTLSPEEASALEAGDILLPSVWMPGVKEVKLLLAAHDRVLMTGDATIEENTITLARSMTGFTERNMQDINDLEVSLTFELDRRTITIGELKALEPGFLFHLSPRGDAPVTVLANGCPIGRGRLVDVGGAPGIQLTETIPARAEK